MLYIKDHGALLTDIYSAEESVILAARLARQEFVVP